MCRIIVPRCATAQYDWHIHSVDATAFESIFFFIECTTFKPTESTRRETGWLLVRQKQPGVKLDVYLSLTLFRVRFRWSLSRLYRDCLGVSPREGLMYEVGTDDYYVSDYFKSPHFESGWVRLFAQLRESFSRVSDFFRWRRRPTFRLPLSGERPLQDLFEFLCECHQQHVMSTHTLPLLWTLIVHSPSERLMSILALSLLWLPVSEPNLRTIFFLSLGYFSSRGTTLFYRVWLNASLQFRAKIQMVFLLLSSLHFYISFRMPDEFISGNDRDHMSLCIYLFLRLIDLFIWASMIWFFYFGFDEWLICFVATSGTTGVCWSNLSNPNPSSSKASRPSILKITRKYPKITRMWMRIPLFF